MGSIDTSKTTQDTDIDSQLATKKLTQDALSERYCNGVMGVPITYLDSYNPEEFEIIGIACGNSWANYKNILQSVEFDPTVKYGGGLGSGVINGKGCYARLLLRKMFVYANPKYWEEWLAKYILENQYHYCLRKTESPDLQNYNKTLGIEVTKAYPPEYNRSEGNYEKHCIAERKGQVEKSKVYLDKSETGGAMFYSHNQPITIENWKGTMRVGGLIRNSDLEFQLYKEALKKKTEKLNESYSYFTDNGLFVLMLNIPCENDCEKYIEEALRSSKQAKHYSKIWIYGITTRYLMYIETTTKKIKISQVSEGCNTKYWPD